ncbi:hypothetical protein RJ641_007567 [Dillenia turbinata]|uniref:Uncharacterized protein n=1 Tax=Dillenia turbinata TaxID=194707 RepID=A0AAN8Z9X3_9MAGN
MHPPPKPSSAEKTSLSYFLKP